MGTTKKADGARQATGRGEQPIIGFLCDQLYNEYNINIWRGVRDAAWEHGVNLIYFPGGMLHVPDVPYRSAEVLYDLVSPQTLDGLVIWGAQLVHYAGPEELSKFCERYRPLPIVNIGLALEGIPSLLIDNYQGMRDVVNHLIEVHGYRRIAFICGPEGNIEAQERHRAYVDALAEHGISLDPALVVNWRETADFYREQPHMSSRRLVGSVEGEAGTRILLDERGLVPGTDFDAVVGHSDGPTLDVLDLLYARGIQVPGDVAVASFDDIEESRQVTPPLTTARQSFYDLGVQATEMLLALLAGEEVAERVILSMKVMVRQSCGCSDPAVEQAAVGPVGDGDGRATGQKLETILAVRREEILSEMVTAVGVSAGGLDPEWAGRLLESFSAVLRGRPPHVFLRELDRVLRRVVTAGSDVIAWQGVVSVLRRQILPCLSGDVSRGEDLCQQARVVIGEMAQRAQAYQARQAERQVQMLRGIEATLAATFDVQGLMNALAEGLPRLDMPSAYLSLYEDPGKPAEWSRLMLAYDEGGRVELKTSGLRFPSCNLVPEGMLPARQYSFVVEPLYFGEHQFGFTLFEVGPREGIVYDALRGAISSALQGALFLQARERAEKALEQAYAGVEQQVEQRTAELQQEIEERERAQGENLRLQRKMIEAQQQAIQELSTPIIPVLEGVIVMPLIGSVDTLRARDVTRSLLRGIQEHRARVVILDITGVPIVDSGVAAYLNKTIQAARLKGARTIVTGVSEAVAETIVDLGIDWSGIETLSDLRTGLQVAMAKMGRRVG